MDRIRTSGEELKLLAIHVYKCGGSSFRKHITDHLVTPDTFFVDQWAYTWERELPSDDLLLGNLVRAETLRFDVLGKAAGRTVVLSHAFFYEFMKQLPGFSLATMLRDPVERVLSQFGFEQRAFGLHGETSEEGWLQGLTPLVYNLQTAALCGCPRYQINEVNLEQAKANLHLFDFIGLVHEYDLSLRLFNQVYGIDSRAPAPQVNVKPGMRREIPETLREQLSERCRFDVELVAYAIQLFRAKIAAFEVIGAEDKSACPPSLARVAEPGCT